MAMKKIRHSTDVLESCLGSEKKSENDLFGIREWFLSLNGPLITISVGVRSLMIRGS